jgi:predicted ATPase
VILGLDLVHCHRNPVTVIPAIPHRNPVTVIPCFPGRIPPGTLIAARWRVLIPSMNADSLDRFVIVEFKRFKAFESFRLDFRKFNVLVGPNNAGKSTVIAAFRILSEAMRRAGSRKAEIFQGPTGRVYGHAVDLRGAFIAEENVFFDYHDDEAAYIKFTLESQHTLTLYFPEQGTCYLIPDALGKSCNTPGTFKHHFRCKIGFAPILSPVDHKERLYQAEAARLALLNYEASRNFRNIWYHFPDKFDQFRDLVETTWPGMSVERPEVERVDDKACLFMYCPEKRKPREIFWSGFGFQIWCQMLTHIVQASSVSIFLIDEPDVYLHSDLQRQLIAILKELGPTIVLATHSTEIIAECDADEIVLVSKERPRARRLRSPTELGTVFSILGSSANPILTQLAKTRRVIFVEGLDFKLIGQFARKLGENRVAARGDFAVVPTEGFNPEKIKSLQVGMEHPLGRNVLSGAILDRDFRSDAECKAITSSLGEKCEFALIHPRKEIENFVLVPTAIDRVVNARVKARQRTGSALPDYVPCSEEILLSYAASTKTYLMSQFTEKYKKFERTSGSKAHEATLIQAAMDEFERRWSDSDDRLRMVAGKDALSHLNGELQKRYKVSVTPTAIVESMRLDEVPQGIREMISVIASFIKKVAPN